MTKKNKQISLQIDEATQARLDDLREWGYSNNSAIVRTAVYLLHAREAAEQSCKVARERETD